MEKNSQLLRAIAIIGVITIHLLSSLKKSPFLSDPNSIQQFLSIFIDQLSRICVPLFVALSGFGLYSKYSTQKIKLKEFLFKRAFKLIPLYVFFSFFYLVLFWLIPAWAPATQQPHFIWQLFLGRADYHLYFVPMIFQLYLIFPLILLCYKKFPYSTLIVSLCIQLVWFYHYSYSDNAPLSLNIFQMDREQYLWATNWIWYFALGIFIADNYKKIVTSKMVGIVTLCCAVFTLLLISMNVQKQIVSGLDPLYALKFTRYPIMLYASFGVAGLFWFIHNLNKNIRNSSSLPVRLFQFIGTHSYLIYLSHTFFLRILFSL